MRLLRSRLYDAERLRAAQDRASSKKALMGGGSRSERIRTYNFAQNRVTDHRLSLTIHDMEGMMDGMRLDDFADALHDAERANALGDLNIDLSTFVLNDSA